MANLLFIDDDIETSSILAKYFTKQGYAVKTTSKPADTINLIKNFKPDCIILDIMMPIQNGFTTCKQIRANHTVPIIFLSGCVTEDDKVKGLMLGGDDYITKPYSLRELHARIQVQLRKSTLSTPSLLSYPPLSLDLALHKAFYNETVIHLSNREYELLYLLASRPNQTVTYQEIGETMWHYYSDSDRPTIMVTASRLRKKIESFEGLSNLIESVWSKGYKFIAK